MQIVRVHTHIGSGSDPHVWMRVSQLSVNLCRHFPNATVLNLGGGYKVARVAGEVSTSLAVIGKPVAATLTAFAEETGRRLHLEIEPGTFLVARAGVLVSTIQDMVSTSEAGHVASTSGDTGRHFIKLDTGMSDMLRPQMYGAQHGLRLIAMQNRDNEQHTNPKATLAPVPYVIVGHCCESGDIFTPKPNNPDLVDSRLFARAQVGDLVVIEAAGA